MLTSISSRFAKKRNSFFLQKSRTVEKLELILKFPLFIKTFTDAIESFLWLFEFQNIHICWVEIYIKRLASEEPIKELDARFLRYLSKMFLTFFH